MAKFKQVKQEEKTTLPIQPEEPQFQINNYVIVDNEVENELRIRILMNKHYSAISHLGSYSTFEEAISNLPVDKPDLIFMDVYLNNSYTCFNIFESIPEDNYRVIFTTHTDKYFQKVFEFNMVDYLIKPVRLENLLKAVNKAHTVEFVERNKIFNTRQVMTRHFQLQRKIEISNGFKKSLIKIADIVAFKPHPNEKRKSCVFLSNHKVKNELTTFTTVQKSKLISEHSLPDCFFEHRSFVLNLDRISGYVFLGKEETGIHLDTGEFWPLNPKTLRRIIAALANLK